MAGGSGVSLRLLLIGSHASAGWSASAVGVHRRVRQYQTQDHAITVISFVVVLSTPVFLLAVLLKVGGGEVNQARRQLSCSPTPASTPRG